MPPSFDPTNTIGLDKAHLLVSDILAAHGVSASNREVLAHLITQAEHEGCRSHGLMRLPDYVSSIRSGWIDPAAEPAIAAGKGSFVTADCRRGFTQVAAVQARALLIETARCNGIAALTVSNGHHLGALWLDVEPLAKQGLVALNFVNSRCRLAAFGATGKVLGTNAMAFGVPDGQGGTLGWDQAASMMSLGDVKLHAAAGTPLPEGIGLDKWGAPTREAHAILDGGALLPFGGHKGASIALMVEVMAAALTGGNFGFEDDSAQFPGAASSNAGQLLLVVDPDGAGQRTFAQRMRRLVEHLRTHEVIRLPGDRRARARANSGGALSVPTELLQTLRTLMTSP